MLKYALIITLVMTIGCATTPVAALKAKQVAADRLYAWQESTPETTSTLVVTRDEGFKGSFCYFALFVNDSLAARLGAGETSRFRFEPGVVRLSVGRDPYGVGVCATAGAWEQRAFIASLNAEETMYLRMKIDNAIVSLEPARN